ncbi:uncharacterized protein LOC124648453 [Lolium rigidum]|uniref:uncharacterized protein LOC124648453 n=1 Tax=Lolium rigidum TaxID=89674 RepID=UPI001F5D9E1D|nr:uncharacterized protein LOC124648453 [Lolium rigidum]
MTRSRTMKPRFFFLHIQLLAITLQCIASNATQPVFDTEGSQLDSNHNYYILPAKGGGGLKAIPTGLRCLNFVVQESNSNLLGTTLQFTPLPPNTSASETIHLSSDIWIEFHDLESFCSDRLDWHITERSPEAADRLKHVAAGNEDGVRSFAVFRIERHGADAMGYKIMSCVDKGPCKDLGLHNKKTQATSKCKSPRSFNANFFFLLIQLLAITLHCIANNPTQPVYDTEGSQLDNNHNYYILPAKGGGGLKAIPTGLRCLNFVAQESNSNLLGTTLRFTPLPPNTSASETIHLSSDIWIEFHDLESFCSDRLDWHITERSPEAADRLKHVAAGNEDGVRSFAVFRIERHGADAMGYKIMSCVDKGPCKDLGLHVYKDKTWLTISDEPFMVVFRKK